MSRYRFELATPVDDADLRHVLAATPMDGKIVVSFRRDPNFFDASSVDGYFRQVVAARDTQSGRIVGFGSRSVSMRYVNGQPTPVGYLSNLRCLAEHRGLGLVARGYRFFSELHDDRRTPIYLTTIAHGNRVAMDLLTSGRAGLPKYAQAGDYHTVAIPTGAIPTGKYRARAKRNGGLSIRAATAKDVAAMVALLKVIGPRRQFFPCYEAADLDGSSGLLRGMVVSNFVLAFRGDRLVGFAGKWNQQAFRQTVIERYAGRLAATRPLINMAATILGRPKLPAAGSQLRYVAVAVPVVADDDGEVFTALLDELITSTTRDEADYILLGLHSSDPLLAVARRYPGTWYDTRLFLVSWSDGDEFVSSLDNRPSYLELGAL